MLDNLIQMSSVGWKEYKLIGSYMGYNSMSIFRKQESIIEWVFGTLSNICVTSFMKVYVKMTTSLRFFLHIAI